MTFYRWYELTGFVIGFGAIAGIITLLASIATTHLRRRWIRRQVMNLIRRDAEKAMARKAQMERQG